MEQGGYAGDLSAREAYAILEADENAVLLDVRSLPEWQFVGVADLKSIGRPTLYLSWQDYPDMAVNPDFAANVQAKSVAPDQTVLVICRSGGRSRAAAIALTGAGFRRAFNIVGGFEGPLDQQGHRGAADGWKAVGLPWLQQ